MDPKPSDSNAPPVARPVTDTDPSGATVPQVCGPVGPRGPAEAFLSPPKHPGELGRLGPYRILGVLGRGGMGVVYLAEDPRLKRAVAIKVLLPELSADPRAKARFVREARAQAKVTHDNIIPIHAVAEVNGVAYIEMPLLRGQTLDAALKQNARPPLAEVVRIGREIAEGLAAAHEAGLVHRDIKPSNVWLEGAKRRVKILDFGLARGAGAAEAPRPDAPLLTPPGSATDVLTRAGAVLGTPSYMSPEQARGHVVDHRSDIFSLGVLLYEMATGQRPFTGQTSYEVLAAVAAHDPAPVSALAPDAPPALSDLIQRTLAKDPAARPPSCEAVADELALIGGGSLPVQVFPVGPVPGTPNPWADIDLTEAVSDSSSVSVTDAPTPKPRERTARASRDIRWVWGAAAAAVLLALVAVGVVAWQLTKKPTEAVKGDDPPPKPKPVPKPDPDRDLAKLVFEKKGSVSIEGRVGLLSKVEDLPVAPFKLTVVHMHPPTTLPLSDEDLDKFQGVDGLTEVLIAGPFTDDALIKLLNQPFAPKLKVLQLAAPEVTDRGAAAIARCTALTSLNFWHAPKLTDDGLACLAQMPNLRALEVSNTKLVTGAGLKHLRGENLTYMRFFAAKLTDAAGPHVAKCSQLTELELSGTFTDAAVVPLAKLTKLQKLGLTSPGITDRGLEALAGLPNLFEFVVTSNAITDTGIGHIGKMSRLTNLYIAGKFSDAGLEKLHGLKSLQTFQLTYATGFTLDGVRKLRAALPACKVRTSLDQEADRKASEWVLARGGVVYTSEGNFTSGAKLPSAFELHGVEVPNAPKPLTAADLEVFRDADRLTTVLLLGPGVDDAGLKVLAGFPCAPNIGILALPNATVTPDGLSLLTAFKKAQDLRFRGSNLTGTGLGVLRKMPNLTQLVLSHNPLADDILDDIAAISTLSTLDLVHTEVTDDGIQKLAVLKNLRALNVAGTKVTKAGAERLFKELPLCKIEHNGGTIGPKKPLGREEAVKELFARGAAVWNGGNGVTDPAKFHPQDVSLSFASGKYRPLQPSHSGWEGKETDGPVTMPFDGGELTTLLTDLKVNDFRFLYLSGQNLTDDGLARLFTLPAVHTVTVLGITECAVGDATAARAATLPKLERLQLNGTKVTNAGVKAVAETRPNLDQLRLRDCAITDDALPDLKKLTKLKSLDLKGTKVTESGAKELQKALPNCAIRYGDGKVLEPAKKP